MPSFLSLNKVVCYEVFVLIFLLAFCDILKEENSSLSNESSDPNTDNNISDLIFLVAWHPFQKNSTRKVTIHRPRKGGGLSPRFQRCRSALSYLTPVAIDGAKTWRNIPRFLEVMLLPCATIPRHSMGPLYLPTVHGWFMFMANE